MFPSKKLYVSRQGNIETLFASYTIRKDVLRWRKTNDEKADLEVEAGKNKKALLGA